MRNLMNSDIEPSWLNQTNNCIQDCNWNIIDKNEIISEIISIKDFEFVILYLNEIDSTYKSLKNNTDTDVYIDDITKEIESIYKTVINIAKWKNLNWNESSLFILFILKTKNTTKYKKCIENIIMWNWIWIQSSEREKYEKVLELLRKMYENFMKYMQSNKNLH